MTARKSRADYPDGVLGIYDNGGLREYRGEWRGSADRYTVVYDGETDGRGQTFYPYLAMSTRPFHPQGIGIHGETPFRITRGPGERCIAFEDLPEDCQRAVRQDLAITVCSFADNGGDGSGMTFAEQVAENTAYIVAEYMIDGGYVSPGGEA